MAIINLAAPWMIFYKELQELFRGDPGVHVIYDENQCEVKIYVEDSAKASALNQLLPAEKEYGNVTMPITVVPGNRVFTASKKAALYEAAFAGNKALSYIRTVSGIMTNDITYVVFAHKVVQYFADDLGDAHGLRSTLYQEIAKDVFGEHEGVFFCTDVEDEKVYSPEWP